MLRLVRKYNTLNFSILKKIKWTGTTGGEVIRPHDVAEAEEKDIIEKDKYIKKLNTLY
tara:strand:+ start:4498 stop:4671 length:174 start_codon:yes stop_codon:yes gene_type:complete